MSTSVPVVTLTVLGALLAVLALFSGGNTELIIVGLAAIAVAGLFQVLGRRRES